MTDRIASGEIAIEVNDREALASLRNIERRFDETMSDIDRQRAEVTIGGDLSNLEDDLANAKRKLRKLEGEKAEVTIGVRKGDEAKFDKAIEKARLEIKSIDGLRAEMEIEVKGDEQAKRKLAQLRAQEEKLAAARAAEIRKLGLLQDRALREDERRTAKRAAAIQALGRIQEKAYAEDERRVRTLARLQDQAAATDAKRLSDREAADRRLATMQSQALRMDEQRNRARRQAGVTLAQETAKVAQLQREYARLTDQMERLSKKRPIGREATAKVNLEVAGTIAKMEALKAQLEFMGSHPPVGIKVDIDRRGIDRVKGFFSDFLTMIGNKASGLSDLTVRIGPFTASLKQLATALSFLGPTIVDVLGATGALIGVLGAGVSGAAALGAGAVGGLALGFLGLKFSMRDTGQELAQARTSINAYQAAVLKFGRGSDKAKAKQDEMKSVLKQISPLAREAALGTEEFFGAWDKATKPTKRNLGTIAKEGFKALNDLRPIWASRTNEMSGILAKNLTSAFRTLGGGKGKSLLDGIFGDFNENLPQLLHGLGSFGLGFLNFTREGARNLGLLTGGVDSLGTKFLNFTKSDDFGATIRRWALDARDLMRLFGAMGRVTMHFFGAGERAGLGLVHSMTDALNDWDKKLTGSGRKGVAAGFERAADGARALWNAIAPMAGAFIEWSSNLSPFVTGLLTGAGYVSRIVAGVTEIVGMTGAIGTLGATIGAMWALGKVGAFVSYLARAVELLRTMTAMEAVKSIAGGGFLGSLKGGAGVAQAGATAAAEMRAGIISGGTVVAAELRAAMAGGAIAGGAPGALAKRLVPAAGAAAGVGALEAAAVPAAAATAGIGIAAAATVVGVAALAVGTGVLVYKLAQHKSATDKLNDSIKENQTAIQNDKTAVEEWNEQQTRATQTRDTARKSIRELKADLDKTTKGTVAHREAELRLYDARVKSNDAIVKRTEAANRARGMAANEVGDAKKAIDLIKQRTAEEVKQLNARRHQGLAPSEVAAINARVAEAEAKGAAAASVAQRQLTVALNARAAATLNVARASANMAALTGKAAQSAGRLARERPNLAQKIAVKYDSPKNVGDVSNAARRALGSGVKLKTVIEIIADSKNAEAALRRLRTAEVARKMVKFGISGDDGVLSKLSAIDRKAIKRKIAKIIEQGGTPTLAMITSIIQRQIRDKRFSITSQAGQALTTLALVRSGLSEIRSKSITVSIRHMETGRPQNAGKSKSVQGGATGGESTGWKKANSGMFDKPTFMVGEESRPEFVIATNPAYRRDNVKYLMQAAEALGVPMFKKGKGYKKGVKAGGKALDKARTKGVLPPKLRDYISDVDLTDLTTMDSEALSAYKEQRDKVSDWAKMKAKDKKGKHAPSRAAMNQRKGYYDKIHGHLKRATQKKAEFTNLETDIDALDTAMQSANLDKDGNAVYKGTRYGFAKLKSMRQDLITKRTGKLQDAAKDLPKDPKDPATKTAWYSQINKALGESILEGQQNELAEKDTPEEVPETDAQRAARESTEQFGSPTAAAELGEIEKNIAISEMNDAPDDPTTIYTNESAEALKDNLGPASSLVGFWKATFDRLVSSGGTADAITAAAQGFKTSSDALRTLNEGINAPATTTAGEQYGFLSNARNDLYSQMGSNVMPIWNASGSPGSGGAFGPNMGGGTVKNVTVNNTFPTPPADPHIWSQGVSWELQNAI